MLCLQATSAFAQGAPKLVFESTTVDFGKVAQVSTVSGVFKFKNTGTGILKLQPPKPSCGCTVPELKPDTLNPGETGELRFVLSLGLYRAILEKHIAVTSNDAANPEQSLTIRADYTPLYELAPVSLSPNLAFGVNEATAVSTLTRNDGGALRIDRLVASKPWIRAVVEPGDKPGDSTTKVRITVQRDGAPRRFNEYVHIYAADQTNAPVSSLYLSGQMMGEISLIPEALYWSITDDQKVGGTRPEAMVVRRVAIRSSAGRPVTITKAMSSIPGVSVELVETEPGKAFELVARLNEVPTQTVSGTVSVQTSVESQSQIVLPVVVNVFHP